MKLNIIQFTKTLLKIRNLKFSYIFFVGCISLVERSGTPKESKWKGFKEYTLLLRGELINNAALTTYEIINNGEKKYICNIKVRTNISFVRRNIIFFFLIII